MEAPSSGSLGLAEEPQGILFTPPPPAESGQHAEGPYCLQPVCTLWIFDIQNSFGSSTLNTFTCQLSPGAQMYFCCGYLCHICNSASSCRLFRYFSCKDTFMCAKTSHYKIFCEVWKFSTQGVTSAMWNCLFMLCSSKLTPSHQRSSAQNLKTPWVVLKSHRLVL